MIPLSRTSLIGISTRLRKYCTTKINLNKQQTLHSDYAYTCCQYWQQLGRPERLSSDKLILSFIQLAGIVTNLSYLYQREAMLEGIFQDPESGTSNWKELC